MNKELIKKTISSFRQELIDRNYSKCIIWQYGKICRNFMNWATSDDIRYFSVSSPKLQTSVFAQDSRPESPAHAVPDLSDTEKDEQPMKVTLNHREIELYPKGDHSPYLFVDMLNFVDIDPSKPQGNIFLRINGREASYLDPVLSGDFIEIHWDRSGK